MKHEVTISDLKKQIRRYFAKWFVCAFFAGLVVLLIHFVTMEERGRAYAVVNYSFEGIDKGMDPNGNYFDVNGMISSEVITEAAAAMDLELSDEDIANIQANFIIQGVFPDEVIADITSHSSMYREGEVSALTAEKLSSYYPTRYNVQFNYRGAGFSKKVGAELFNKILTTYSDLFYDEYGYNRKLLQNLSVFRYVDYDYDSGIDVLNNKLQVLHDYVAELKEKDTTNYRSTATGYIFSDIEAAINTVIRQDISRISSFVTSNNVTKQWKQMVDEFNYLIEQGEREQLALEERIANLTETIDGYAKTQAIVMGNSMVSQEGDAESSSGGGSTAMNSVYQISQQSDLYDEMIQQRVDLQSELSNVQQQIDMYKMRVSNIRKNSSEEDVAYVDDQLSQIQTKLTNLITETRRTAREYSSNAAMQRAFQVVNIRENGFSIGRLLRVSLGEGIAVEAIILAIFLIQCTYLAMTGKKVSNDFIGKKKLKNIILRKGRE